MRGQLRREYKTTGHVDETTIESEISADAFEALADERKTTEIYQTVSNVFSASGTIAFRVN